MDTKTRAVYMLSTSDPLQTEEQILTESEGMEKDIPCKWKSKEKKHKHFKHILKKPNWEKTLCNS